MRTEGQGWEYVTNAHRGSGAGVEYVRHAPRVRQNPKTHFKVVGATENQIVRYITHCSSQQDEPLSPALRTGL